VSARALLSLAIAIWAFSPVAGFEVIDADRTTPDFDKIVGHQDRCYDPTVIGPSTIPSEFLIAGTSTVPSGTGGADGRVPFLSTVDLEGRSRDVPFIGEAGLYLEVRGAARLDGDSIVVAAVTAEGQVLQLLDSTGKVTRSVKLAPDVDVRGIERGSANDFLIYGSLGSRPYYAGLNRTLAAVFERFPAEAAASGQVLKAHYAAARDGVLMVVQRIDGGSADKATVTLAKHDLLGNLVASVEARSVYADFDEARDGIAFLYFTGDGRVQTIQVTYFDRTLKPLWQAEPIPTRLGVAAPRVAALKDETVVVAANEFTLLLAALDGKGQPIRTYREAGPSLSAGGTYLVAHDSTRLLIAQPDRRAGDATHPAPDPMCTRIRVVRF
jgi:hypothetical protein